ncbi:uncharacterized protein K489DRAFT_391440 [Dissoconium aciculare CBS 342.82]|uniref:Translocation protein sec66 n=1 Tax=Dissoconium aciculare CBS 342.82 TaxID=1314786 RepID=A0A6J3LQ33_9PEZI|nr:uncharacterized protein K489DRAFT_391440 [Dissoconium aciculare CBS 342.82]KAF1817970.1 hypothetical protein K489DRAFT_391440 [Dissoconium aciculare CBS 342.82]
MVFWSGLLLPVLYLTILIGSLATFSSLYRRRQIAKAAQLESWFPPHRARDLYLSLLHIDPAEASSESEQKITQVPDSLLKAALLRRALEDIRRIVQLRGSKQALQNLVQRGSVGDELWQRFQRAEQEMEAEVKDVAQEAEALVPGWGQVIFQSANEFNQHNLLRERIFELKDKKEADIAWWAARKAGIQSEFMKELEEEELKKAQGGEGECACHRPFGFPGGFAPPLRPSENRGFRLIITVSTGSGGGGGKCPAPRGQPRVVVSQ